MLAAVLAALTGACSRPEPTWPKDARLVVAMESAPIHLDPRVGTDQASSRVYEVMLNGLLTRRPDGGLEPDLAESWEVLDDGLRYRFHLRRGITFHDGRPFTSADVAWTFGTLLDGTVLSPKRGAFDRLREVRAVDPETVDFLLTEPYGALPVNLTSYVGIVPDGVTPEEMNRAPVGTGPFRFVERSPDQVVLAAWDGYRDGRPALDRLILREVPDSTVRALELRKGTVQLVVNALPPDMVPAFRADPSFQVVEDPGSNYVYLGLNLEDPILSDVRVRRALAHAIDRPRIVASLWRGLGIPTETLIPPGHWARDDGLEPIAYDPVAAGWLLDQAGYPLPPGGGPRLALTYKTSTDETALLQAQIIQQMLSEVGVALTIRSFEFATFYSDIKRGSFQLFSLTWTGVADPDIYAYILHSGRIPPAGANRGRYRNPEFDRAIEAGARATLPEERRPHYLRAQEILARDLPYISLFTKVNVAVLAAPLEGYRNYPGGELYSLARMRWRRS